MAFKLDAGRRLPGEWDVPLAWMRRRRLRKWAASIE